MKARAVKARWLANGMTPLGDVQMPTHPVQPVLLVREIFALFDADADGKLSKDEYKNYLTGVGDWGTGGYTDAMWDETWLRDCGLMDCTASGITKGAFEAILYGKYRNSKIHADLDSCDTWKQGGEPN